MPRFLQKILLVLLFAAVALSTLPAIAQTASLTGTVPVAEQPASSPPE